MNNFLKIVSAVVVIGLIAPISLSHAAKSKNLTIKEKTKFYRISGKFAPEFAASMSKKGPYSFQHRRRAWATASREMTYQLEHRQTSKGCTIKQVRVKMTILYEMPKLRLKGISKRHRAKWRRMYNLLDRHEKVHGTYYRQLAAKVRATLRKMPTAKSCRKLRRNAKKLVDKLSEKDRMRNQKFDIQDQPNYRRMQRIFSGTHS